MSKQSDICMTPEWREKLLGIFRFFVKICNENNLRFFCTGGTAIGAVRHKGLIPWDDDIDVMMPRPDYERLLQLCQTMDMGNYELMTPETTKEYYCDYAKICDGTTTLLEQDSLRCVIGINLDIFPLDGSPENVEEAKKRFNKYQKLRRYFLLTNTHQPFSHFLLNIKKGKIKHAMLLAFLYSTRTWSREKLLKKLYDIATKYEYGKGKCVIEYGGYYGDKNVMPVEWFENSISMPFDGIEVSCIGEVDAYLRHFFGDYMQLPPVEARKPHHAVAYVNIEKKESIETVFEKLKNGRNS